MRCLNQNPKQMRMQPGHVGLCVGKSFPGTGNSKSRTGLQAVGQASRPGAQRAERKVGGDGVGGSARQNLPRVRLNGTRLRGAVLSSFTFLKDPARPHWQCGARGDQRGSRRPRKGLPPSARRQRPSEAGRPDSTSRPPAHLSHLSPLVGCPPKGQLSLRGDLAWGQHTRSCKRRRWLRFGPQFSHLVPPHRLSFCGPGDWGSPSLNPGPNPMLQHTSQNKERIAGSGPGVLGWTQLPDTSTVCDMWGRERAGYKAESLDSICVKTNTRDEWRTSKG